MLFEWRRYPKIEQRDKGFLPIFRLAVRKQESAFDAP